MASSCDFKTSEAATKSWFRKKGIIDEFLNIDSGRLDEFRAKNREYSEYANSKFGILGKLFTEANDGAKAVPNTKMFHRIDAAKGILYDENMKYKRDFSDNYTLTPYDMVNKYVQASSDGRTLEINQPVDFSQEETLKIMLGVNNAYPNIDVTVLPTRMVNNAQHYSLSFRTKISNSITTAAKEEALGYDQIYDTRDKLMVEETIAPLLKKFKGAQVNWVTQEEMNNIVSSTGKVLLAKDGSVTGLAIKNQIYLVNGKVTAATALEEMLHLFVDTLKLERGTLFKGLASKAAEMYPGLAARLKSEYSDELGFSKEDRDIELVTRALRDAYLQERKDKPEGRTTNEFLKLAKEFFKWFVNKLRDLYDIILDEPRADLSNIPLNATIGDLAAYLNINDVLFLGMETTAPRFNVQATGLFEEFDQTEYDASITPEGKDKAEFVKERKLERANSQLVRLKKLRNKLDKENKGQLTKMIETVDKLIFNSTEYINLLKNDTPTVSVTKFVGSPVFTEAFQKSFKPFQDFGTLIHNFLEELQIEAIKTGRSPITIIFNDPAYIEKFYNRPENQELLQVKGVNEKGKLVSKIPLKDLAAGLVNIVSLINQPFTDGEIVIPEITVHGVDSEGRVVDGRLDFIIIKKDGTTTVKDFKTTRSTNPISSYSDKALRKTYNTKQLVEGVHPSFQTFTSRNKISGWLSQLGTYKRILSQIGINSDKDSVISIIYGPNAELLNEEIWAYENMFVAELPLEGGEYSMSLDVDEFGNPAPVVSTLYTNVLNALRIALPIEGEQDTSEAEKKIIMDREYLSNIPNEKMKAILDGLKSKIDQQLSEANAEVTRLYKESSDEQVIKDAINRRDLIRATRNWFDRTSTVAGETQRLPQELVLKGVIDKTRELIRNYVDDINKVKNLDNINNKIAILSERNKQLDGLKNFLDTVRKALLKEENIEANNPLIMSILESMNEAEIGQGEFIHVAGQQFKKVILSLPQKNVQEMMRQMEMYYEIEIPKLEKIIAGDASVFDKGYFWLAGKVRRAFGKYTPQRIITQNMKEAAEEKLKQINDFLKNKEFNEAFVDMYVQNTFQNPESQFYIGSTIQAGFGTLTGDDFRSSYGNSELAITAMANYAIAMTQQASTNFFDRMEKIKVNKLTKIFSDRLGSYTAANEAISKKIVIKDLATGEEVEYMSFRGPVSQQVIDEQDKFDYELNVLSEEISNIKKADIPEEERKIKLKEAGERRKAKRKAYIQWQVENLETELLPEVLLLEAELPDDIKEKIDQFNDEIANIKSKANDQDFLLDDSSLLEIKRLEFEIAQLRKEARATDANLEDIFEKMDMYYEWHINERQYEYAREQVLKNYSEDSKEYKTWEELNSDLIPDPTWVEEYLDLQKQKREIFGEDPTLNDLYAQRNELMGKYRYTSRFNNKSVFNPLYMTDEDYDAFAEIEFQIEEYYQEVAESAGDFFKSNPSAYKKFKEINSKITKMKQSQNKPSYSRELTQRINEIKTINSRLIVEQDPGTQNALRRQLEAKDQEFKMWYDRNNTNEYKLGTIVKGGKVEAAPTSFNIVAIPTDPAKMIRVPNSNYRTRSKKEAAYNPNYSPMIERKRYGRGNYPMPKGIKYIKDTGRFEVDPTARWVDPLYLEMMKDPQIKDFYEKYVLDEYYNKQVNMSAYKLGFLYPGVTQSSFDTLMVDGLEGAKREGREWINNNILLGNSEIEKAENNYGISGRQRIRFAFNYKLPASIGTKDGMNAIMKWGLQYEIYNAMEQANLVISPAIEYLEYGVKPEIDPQNQVARQQVDKVIDILKYERDKFIYGQTFVTPDNKQSNWNTQKLMRQFMTAVSWGRLAFDPAMQLGNLVSGNVQMFLSMQMADGGNGTWKDWVFAKAQMYGRDGFMYNVIGDWGKVDNVSLSTKILRFFNPSMRDLSEVLDLGNRNRMRILLNKGFAIGDLAYVIQDKGEMEIAMSTLLKNLSAHKFFVYEMNPDGTRKVDDQGNPVFKKDLLGNNVTVSAYEALVDKGTATPGLREDVAIDMSDLDAIRARTHQEYLQMQGNYATWTQPKIASTMWGALLLYYRKYLEPFIENRFKGAFGVGDPKNWAAGQAQIGWWTAFFKMIADVGLPKAMYALVPGIITEKLSIQDVNPYYKAKAGQLRRELLYASIAMFAYTTLRSLRYGDDDEKKELTWAQMQAMRVLAKVSNESRSMVYVPYIGRGDDFVQNFATFTTAFNEGKTLFKMTENLGYYVAYEVLDSESAYDKGYYQRKAYRFEEGDPKITANIYALTGIDNVLDVINPEYSVSKLYKKKD